MNLRDASHIAEEVKAAISPLCRLGEDGLPLCCVAGSVRRKKGDLIKSVEIVAVPDSAKLFDLASVINVKWGEPLEGKLPSLYTKIRGRYNLDVYWATTETFGVNYFIRTGPESFVRRALAEWKKISLGGYAKDARLYDGKGNRFETPNEESVFAAIQWAVVKPENRT